MTSALQITIAILTGITAAISITLIFYHVFNERGERGQKAIRKMLQDLGVTSRTIEQAQAAMRHDLSDIQKDVLGTIIFRESQVPLIMLLRNSEERLYIMRALTDPSQFPWDWVEIQDEIRQTSEKVEAIEDNEGKSAL